MSKYGGNNRIDFGVHFNTDKSSLEDVKKSLQALQNIKLADFKGSREELIAIKTEALKVLAALTSAFNVKIGSLNIEKFKKELDGLNIDKLYTDFSKLGSAGQVAFSKMATSMMTTNLQLKETHSLINSMGTTMMNTVKWGIASSVMNNFTQSVSEAFQYVKSLDSALTDIRIVTGDSTEKMALFADQANRAAQSLGRSTMDYSKAALTFYQQGLSDEDVAARTEATLKAQNITGAGLEMADYLTAVWNGYKVANEEAELYVDKLAAVADSSASNMSLLAVAMSKVASTANMLGVPVDSLNAQIATIEATTRQAPETVGNALKTIYARINDIKTGSDDAEVSLGNYTEQMAKLGVNVLDASGNLRDTGDVIEEIGGKWETLSREQQIYLARTMAGQRQYNNLLALFENWGKYTDLVNVSMEAQGTTMLKNSRYMDSLAAHMELLGAAGERVKSAMIDSDSFKGLIDVGTGLTNLFANLIESIGGGGTAFLALGSIVTQVFSGTISREISNLINNFKLADENAKILALDIQQTEEFGKSKGYSEGIINSMVDAKKLAQQYYNIMSEGQINTYNGIVQQIGAAEQQIVKIKDETLAAKKLNEALELAANTQELSIYFDQLEESFGTLKTTINSFSGEGLQTLKDSTVFNDIKQQILSFQESIGDVAKEIPSLNKLSEIFENIKNPAEMTNTELNKLKFYLDSLVQETGKLFTLIGKFDDLNYKTQLALANLKQATLAKDQFLDAIKTEAYTKQILGMISGVGRLASGFMALSNIVNVWSNDSLNAGQKILQTFTNIGFVIPMIATSLKSITKGWQSLTDLIKTQGALALKEKTKEATATSVVVATTTAETKAHQANTRAILQLTMARAIANGDMTLASSLIPLLTGETLALGAGSTEAAGGVALLGTAEAVTTGETIGLGTALKALFPHLTLIAGIAAGVVALGVTIYGISKAYNSASDNAKKAAEVANEAKLVYSLTRQTLNDLNSGFNQLENAKNTLANLTQGSEEWKNSLMEVNDQVLSLCEKFPLLNGYLYTTSEGMLDFKLGAQDVLVANQQKNVQASGNAYIQKQKLAIEAQNYSILIDASRDNKYPGTYEDLKKITDAINEHGSQLLDNSDKIKEVLGYGSTFVDEIQNNKSELIKLANKLEANVIATENLLQSITKNNLEGVSAYLTSSNQDVFAALVTKANDSATLGDLYYNTRTTRSGRHEVLDEEALKLRYAEMVGLEADMFRIRKDLLQMKNENGDWEKQMSLDLLKTTVAQRDLLDNIDNTYSDISSKMSKVLSMFGGDQNAINSAYEVLINGLDILADSFSQSSIKALKDHSDKLAELAKVDENLLQLKLEKISGNIRKNFNSFIDSLSPTIQEAFKNLGVNSDNYSLEAAKALEKILMKGFLAEGDIGVDFMGNFLKGLDSSKLPDFENFINTLNPTSLSVDSLKESLEEAGFNINATDEQLALFIDYLNKTKEAAQTPLEAYKTIHLVGDGLKRGDLIEGEDKEKLEAAGVNVDRFFEETLKGTYLLKVSAEEWENYVNNISLEPAKEKIKEFQDQINGLSTFNETSKYAYKENQDNEATWKEFIGEGAAGGNSQIKDRGQNPLLGLQLNFIKGLNDLTAEQEQLILKVSDAYENNGTVTKEQGLKIKEILISHKGVWEDIPGAVKDAEDSIDEYNKKIEATQDILDEDVDEEQWDKLSRELSRLAKEFGDPDNIGALLISELLEYDRLAAEDLAEAMLRYDNALQQVADNYDEWQRALSSGAIQDQALAASLLRNVYGDLLDVSDLSFSDAFLQDANNLELLKQAANGSELAYNQLREAAIQDIITHADLDLSDFHNSKDELINSIHNVQNEVSDIEIGAHIQDAQIYNQLNDIINATATTKEQALAMLADMGFSGEIEQAEVPLDQIQNWTNADPDVSYEDVNVPGFLPIIGEALGDLIPASIKVPRIHYKTDTNKLESKGKKTFTTFRVKSGSLKKSAGGGFKYKNSSYGGGNKGSSGKSGGGGKKGGGSSAKPSIAKTNTTKIDTKKKTQENDPYYKVNKSLDKQSTLLKRLQDQEKNLSGKDRLKNLEAQAKNLKEQNELLELRNRISNNVAAENSTANLRKRLQDAFGKNISFDSEGKIADLNQTERAAVDSYNKAAQQAQSTFESVQKQYNNWILHTWNANSKAWQEAHQSEKEKWDERIKNAETNAKDAISAAEEEYKKKTDLIKAYEKALQEDQKRYELYMNNIRKIMESTFEQRKIKIQFDLDSGELDRDWQDFENKVIRKIKDSDIVGNAAAQFRELSSYIQSQELQSVSDEIKAISDDIARVNAGAWTLLMGISQTDYEMLKPEDQLLIRKEALGRLELQLKDYVKTEQEALSAIQDLTDEITENYLDSIDAAKDALDEHIDQYERINDLIEHNVKLTELLYGDKGYDTLNKYYDLQKQNNMNTLQTLKQQEEYWRNRMQNEVVGSEAWKKFKENLDDAVDAVNSKLEDMLDNLTTQFEKKLAAAVERVNNKLTGGLGTSYLDEQWDYLNNYDDYFLDTYNATTGIEDVTRAYQQALDDAAANPKQQQRLNKLMNDQLKILREKDHLTEYDLERAKSMLEVEKARMALEDARNNKTKMRLRRDSQGNYTYQYVADEEKLGDLQQALADAQNDLYNQDKEHYKENLNTLYDTYKEYLEKMQELTEEYRQALAEAEATGNDTWLKQVQARIDLAKEQYDKFYTGLLEDNEYNQTYVTLAFANGLNLDLSGLSSEEAWGVIQENVPWAASNIQNLANSISNLGGLLPATNSLLQDFSSAAAQYKADMNDILEAGGTSILTIGQVIDEEGGPLDTNIIEANSLVIMGYLDEITQKALTDVNTMQDLTQKLDEYWLNLNNNIQTYINNTREAYNTLQELLDSSTRAEVLDYTVPQTNTTSTEGLAQAKEQLSLENISGEDIKALYDSYLSYLLNTNGALEVPRSQVLYQQLAENQQQLQEQYDRFYTDLVQDMIQQISSMSIDSQIDQMTAGTSQLLSNLIKNQSLLDQNVHIDANFPNVNNHTLIEEAFNNLVNMAAMRASGYRD